MAGDVVVKVTINKINGHTRVDAGYMEHVGVVPIQINMCDLATMYTHPMELNGWRISSMNQGFMPNFQHNKRPGNMN